MVLCILHIYCSLQGVESEMCPSFIEAMKAGKPVKIVSDPTTLADGLNVPKVSIGITGNQKFFRSV